MIAYRNISDTRNERTFVASVIPRCGVGHSATVLTIDDKHIAKACCLLANANSIVFDFAVRQKVPAMNVSAFMVEQFPFLDPDQYAPADVNFITERVVELTYTTTDMRDLGLSMVTQVRLICGIRIAVLSCALNLMRELRSYTALQRRTCATFSIQPK